MIFNKLFSKKPARLSFTPDMPESERQQLVSEFKDCANRQGGSLKNARRSQALAELFHRLSPAGKQVFADLLQSLNDAVQQATGERYAEIEEAELFGGSESKLAVFDMFETPRRRLLSHLGLICRLARDDCDIVGVDTELVKKVHVGMHADVQDTRSSGSSSSRPKRTGLTTSIRTRPRQASPPSVPKARRTRTHHRTR